MRAVVVKACAVWEVTSFVEDLDRDACPVSDDALGSDSGAQARARFRRFSSLSWRLAQIVVLPIRENFWSLMGRRVRMLDLSDSRRRVILSWGADFRAALKVYRSADPQSMVQMLVGTNVLDTSDLFLCALVCGSL